MFVLKEKDEEQKSFYFKNPISYLSKDTFFKSVISYPNAFLQDFDFTNINETEKKLIATIFLFITNIEKKILN